MCLVCLRIYVLSTSRDNGAQIYLSGNKLVHGKMMEDFFILIPSDDAL